MWVRVSQLPWDRPFHSRLHKNRSIIDGKLNEGAGAAMENNHTPQRGTAAFSAHTQLCSSLAPDRYGVCPKEISEPGCSSWKLLLQGEVFLSCAGWPAYTSSTSKLTGTGPATLDRTCHLWPTIILFPACNKVVISPRERGGNHLGQAPKKHTIDPAVAQGKWWTHRDGLGCSGTQQAWS